MKELYVNIVINDDSYDILSWRMYDIGQWEFDDSLHVWQGPDEFEIGDPMDVWAGLDFA